MNKQKRTALIQSLSTQQMLAQRADDFVRIATEMADSESQGRTDRWKDACAYAGDLILDEYDDAGKVYTTTCSDAVEAGISAMANANK